MLLKVLGKLNLYCSHDVQGWSWFVAQQQPQSPRQPQICSNAITSIPRIPIQPQSPSRRVKCTSVQSVLHCSPALKHTNSCPRRTDKDGLYLQKSDESQERQVLVHLLCSTSARFSPGLLTAPPQAGTKWWLCFYPAALEWISGALAGTSARPRSYCLGAFSHHLLHTPGPSSASLPFCSAKRDDERKSGNGADHPSPGFRTAPKSTPTWDSTSACPSK